MLYNNQASSNPTTSPGGGSGVTVTGLKGYNQTFCDNIVADSTLNGGIFMGPSGGLTLGLMHVDRNIFTNFTGGDSKLGCGGGEYTHSNTALCVRNMPTIAKGSVGFW